MKAVSPNSASAFSSKAGLRTNESLMDKTISPNRTRMGQLGQKLSSLQSTLESERAVLKPENYEGSIKHLDDKITRNYQLWEEKYKLIKEQVSKLQDGIATESIAREILDERKTKEVRLVESNIALELNVEKQALIEEEHRALRKVEEKVVAVRNDLAAEEEQRREEVQRQYKIVSDQVSSFRRDLDEERRIREEKNAILIKKLGERMNKFQEVMDVERKVREETENVLFKLLEDIDYKFQTEINKEKNTRERSEEEMLKLLEETCVRIENQLRI